MALEGWGDHSNDLGCSRMGRRQLTPSTAFFSIQLSQVNGAVSHRDERRGRRIDVTGSRNLAMSNNL
jgi:hypothetical protein